MGPKDELDRQLAEAAERIRTEAYITGWNAAVSAINDALKRLGAPEFGKGLEIGHDLGASHNGTPPGITQGSTPYYVYHAIKKLPGMTGTQIVTAVTEGGHRVGEASIRTSIGRLRRRKLIVSRHGKWFVE